MTGASVHAYSMTRSEEVQGRQGRRGRGKEGARHQPRLPVIMPPAAPCWDGFTADTSSQRKPLPKVYPFPFQKVLAAA